MIRLLLPSTLLSLMFHGYPTPGYATAIVQHRSSGGGGSGYYGQSSTPYPPYSGGQSSSGGGQSYTGKGKQPAYDPPTGGQGFPGGGPPRPPKRPGEGTPPGSQRKKPTVEVAGDDLIRRYEVPGREIYNAWLMADTAEAASQIMLQANALGPDPQGNDWQRRKVLRRRTEAEWTITDTTQALNSNNLMGLKTAVQSLQVGTATNARMRSRRLRHVNVEPYDGNNARTTGANIRIRMEQNKPYTPVGANTRLPAIGGYYESTINIIDGVIFAEQYQDLRQQQSMRTGQSMRFRDIPWDATWSDSMWYLWVSMRGEREKRRGHRLEHIPYKTSATEHPFEYVEPRVPWTELQMVGNDYAPDTGMGNFLNYIFVTNIQDADTLAIILKCMDSRRSENVAIANNLIFPIGHWCFYALLGTSANHMVAEFLAQHRADVLLGHKVLLSATIHNPATVGDQRGPAVQWTVSADVATARTRKTAVENFWLPSADSRGAYGYPSVPERAYEWNC